MATDIQQTLKALKYNRGATKSSLTRFKTYLDSIDETSFNVTNLKKRLSRAEALYSEFHDFNGQIQVIEHESNNEIDVQDFDDHYFELISRAEDILTLGSSNKPNTQSPFEQARHETNGQVRLPQITLPQFSGAFDEWVPFNETFNSLIHSNEGISTVQKFHYLRSSLKGEAANCISEFHITAKNYEIAWAALRERYDNGKLIQKLKLKPKSVNLPVCGIGQSQTQINHVLEVIVRSSYNAFKMPLSCLVLDNITNDIPVDPLNRSTLDIRKGLKLADPEFHIPRKIDLLIGAEFFWQLLCVGQIKVGNTGLIMQKTHLGWVISGPITCSKLMPRVINCNVSSIQSLETAITKFWEIEEPSSKGAYSLDEAECENHFRNSYKRNHEGRFIVKLPVNADPNQALGDSKQIAIRRLNSLENKLLKQPDLRDQYNSFMQEYIELGHMQQINDHEIQTHENASFYLPHHAVVKGDSITTKLRVVFDGSAKSSSGHSLNDILRVGPSVQQDLFSITCRFRSHRIVLTVDITKMYRQILVDPSQTRLQRIVWRFNPSQTIETYELSTVTYGTASAPFLATRALNQLAIEESSAFPLGAKISLRDFYVDDLLTGADSIQEIHQIFAEVTELLARGGFSLRKWASNRMDILSELLPDAVEPTILNIEQDGSIKTLGLQWESGSDRLQYKIPEVTTSKRLNKRSILSQVAQIFDPLGLIGPVIATAKMFIQRLWQLKLSWDESLPLQLHTEWFDFQNALPQLRSIRTKRCVIPYKHRVEIHGFCDASEKGYGACIYIRSITNSGLASSELLCSKSRVAPLKATTIPRFELCAALLLAQLLHKVLPSLEVEINQVYCWTDSTIVIGWINTTARQLKPFVANRVGEIQELTNISNWNHVGTNDNPADVLSRGSTPDYLIDNSLWWHGPPWLMEAQENWPRSIVNVTEVEVPEKRSIPAVSGASTIKNWNIITKYSSFQRLQRVLAYCKRFINNLRYRIKGQDCNITTGPLTIHELEDATMWLVRSVQKEVFTDEVNRLRSNQPIKPESKLKSLNPIIDDKHVMRVGGRLRNAPVHFNEKFPIILPDKHVLTKLLIKQTHCEELHAGAQATLAKLRNKFWPISGRNLVRQVVRNCVTCFKVNPRAYQPIMGDLPKTRLEPSRPFIRTGVDYCGPFLIRSHTRRKTSPSKVYVAIFICMATKAVHIELATSLNTDSFLNALKRFISRRGMVSQMYSDNGSNFVRANKELRELSTMFEGTEYNKIVDTLSNKGITWHFNPPRAPHFGGIWEAAVKSFKYHFKRIVGNVLLTIEEMNTVIAQIKACLNSRPLIPLSDDPDDLSAITPAHFLIGDSLTVNLEPNLLPLNINRLSRLQLLDRLKQHFWQRWSKEYLQQLQQRNKWTSSRGAAPQPGQLVVIKEDNLPPLLWAMGRVVSVHPGKDGITRAATIKTTPAGTREGSSAPKYPVIVFIHGESYEWNSGNPYDGSVLASYGGVVVVTINYRLGILGFLNANTDPYSKSPANYGLMDQIAALHWIQENIAVFGGDPTNVTVVGHGTGAACVNFLLTSSAVPEGVLFHRAILMSGSALSPWALVQEPSRYAAQVAIHANCSLELPHSYLLKCLREKPLEVLISVPIIAPEFAFAFGPSVDGVVIDTGEPPGDNPHYNEYENGKPQKTEPQNAINILNNVLLRKSVVSKLSRYDLMLGVVKAEAYFAFNGEDVQYGIEADRRSKILRTFVRNTYSYHLSEILATIVNEYTDWERPVQHPINIRDETLEALSDAQYVAPVVHTADLHSAEHRNSYLYVFDYQTKFGDYPQRQGCIHGEELPYIFGAPLVGGFMHFGRNYTKSEVLLAETTMIYWSNFARTGNPNEPPEADISHGARQERNRFKNIEWTAYEAVHKKYLNLDTKPKLKNHYRAHRLSFWLNLVPDLHKPGGDDVPRSHHELPDDDPPPPKLPSLNPRKLPTTESPETRSTPNFFNYSALATIATSDSTERVEELGGLSTTTHPVEDGFAAYSTALSVTIAIGCSLLILNVLIFAGVYYQRDKTRMNENGGQPKKRNENGQMPNNICGDLESSIIGVKSDPASILGHHHSHHQLPPPEFADLPQNNATLPRPPPPPKISKANVNTLSSNPLPENQPLLSTHSIQLINTGTLTKKNTQINSKQNIPMEELRV